MLNRALRVVLPLAILAIGIAVFAVFGQRPTPEPRKYTPKPESVLTMAVMPHTGGLDIHADGLVVPYREITRAAEVSGNVVFKSPKCNEGAYVMAGTELIRIDQRNYDLERRRLAGELAQAQVNLQELNVELENAGQLVLLAERELTLRESQQKRVQALRIRGVTSQQEVDEAERNVIITNNALLNAKSQRDTLLTRRSRLEQAVKVGEVLAEKASLDCDRTRITAPVDGVIIRDEVETDSYVQVGAPLFTIEDTSKVEIRCNLRMEELRWILQQAQQGEPGTPLSNQYQHTLPPTKVTVSYRLAEKTYQWEGRLDRFDGIGLDQQTRMAPVRVVVEKPSTNNAGGPRALVRGMYVQLRIHTQPSELLLRVPEKAMQPGNVVWQVKDGKLQRRELTAAKSAGDHVIVVAGSSGLASGDQLVVSPLQTAFNGQKVMIVQPKAENGPTVSDPPQENGS